MGRSGNRVHLRARHRAGYAVGGQLRADRHRRKKSGKSECVQGKIRFPESLRKLRGAFGGSGDRGGLHPASEYPALRVDHKGPAARQARPLRKASGSHREGGNGNVPRRKGKPGVPDGSVCLSAQPLCEGCEKGTGSRNHRKDPLYGGRPYHLRLSEIQHPHAQRDLRRQHLRSGRLRHQPDPSAA